MSRFNTLHTIAALLLGPILAASAHVGDRTYPIYEIPDGLSPDLHDGSVRDWEDFTSAPSVTLADFANLTGEGTQSADDLSAAIYLAWNPRDGRIYFGIERVDDVYVNEYDGTIDQMWRHDNVELMFDGDHSGGLYDGFSVETYSEDERKRLGDAQAQMYVAIARSPTDRLIYTLSAADSWVSFPPWTEVGGSVIDGSPSYSLIEGAITPWDDLNWHGPADSRASTLSAGRIIGFQVSLPDFDTVPGNFHGYSSLWGRPNTWRVADNFVDGMLICAACDVPATPSVVRDDSWARIKASIR